jgi:hypothetical protein
MFLDASHCLYPEEQGQQTMSDQLTQLNSSSFFLYSFVSVFNTTHNSKNYATKKEGARHGREQWRRCCPFDFSSSVFFSLQTTNKGNGG